MPLSDSKRSSRLSSLVQSYLPQIREVTLANDVLDYYVNVGPTTYSDNYHKEPIRRILKRNEVLRNLMVGKGVDSKTLDGLGYSRVESMAKRFVDPSRFERWNDERRNSRDPTSYRGDMYFKVSDFNRENNSYFGGLCAELEIDKADIGMLSWRDIDRSLMGEDDWLTFNVTYDNWVRRLTEPIKPRQVSVDSDFKENTVGLGSSSPVYMKENRSSDHSLVSSNFAVGILDLLSPERVTFHSSEIKRVFDRYFEEWSLGGVSEQDEILLSRLYEDIGDLPAMSVHTTDTLVLRLLFAASRLRKYAEDRSG